MFELVQTGSAESPGPESVVQCDDQRVKKFISNCREWGTQDAETFANMHRSILLKCPCKLLYSKRDCARSGVTTKKGIVLSVFSLVMRLKPGASEQTIINNLTTPAPHQCFTDTQELILYYSTAPPPKKVMFNLLPLPTWPEPWPLTFGWCSGWETDYIIDSKAADNFY